MAINSRKLAVAIPLNRIAGKMNKTESGYAAHLLKLRQQGIIYRFDYEPEKFRLGHDCYYTPDFRIIERENTITFIDVKGTTKRNGQHRPFYKDDSIVKIKLSAELHPMYRWGMSWKTPDGWESKIF